MSEPDTRVTCPRCRRDVLMRHDGRLRAHRPVPGSGPWCPGSHRAATIQPTTEGDTTMTTTDITFVCFTGTDIDTGKTAKTFVAVRTADRERLVRDMFPDPDTDMWLVDFPDLAAMVAAELAVSSVRGTILGTIVDGEWTSWYPPVPAPAVPEAA